MTKTTEKKLKTEVALAAFLVIFGCLLIAGGFIVPPTGEIHPSVLAAFGEILTFAGAIIGVDYSYKKTIYRRGKHTDEDTAGGTIAD